MHDAYKRIAEKLIAIENCRKSNSNDWRRQHEEDIEEIVRDKFPHGSGFDSGTWLDWKASTPEKLVFRTSYHYMNDVGFYDGWYDFKIVVTPSLAFGFNLRVTAGGVKLPDEGLREYVEECFS